MIDLHLHTTASDGLLSPDALVARLVQAGIQTCSVTDHDTVAGLAASAAAAARQGIGFLPGIEITAVEDGGDVHMLGYGFDVSSSRLAEFLEAQRAERRLRARRIIERLAALGMPLDADVVLGAGTASPSPSPSPRQVEGDAASAAPQGHGHGRKQDGKSIGRPVIARALVAAGHVATVSEAFETWLGRGKPAFIERGGASAASVVELIHEVGGLASMAHPGVTRRDDLIPSLVARGLDAIEVWHSDHDSETTQRYLALAEALGLLMTGGSDYHGDQPDRNARLGGVGVPQAAFDRFITRLHDHPHASAEESGEERSRA